MTTEHDPHPRLPRRTFLAGSAVAALGVAAGCSHDNASIPNPTDTTADTTDTTSGTGTAPAGGSALVTGDFEALGTCVLLPEMTAGPFPTIEQLDRRDITEGYPGRPLRLGLRVLDAGCVPVPDVAVEVWHADAGGDYSFYVDGGTGKDEGEGTTFLRGAQISDSDGIAEFRTIYPGWYPGRAVHIHLRVRRGQALVLTSQLFFPDDRTAEVFATSPYAEFGLPDTTNATDGLGGDIDTNGSLLTVMTTGAGEEPALIALLNLGIP